MWGCKYPNLVQFCKDNDIEINNDITNTKYIFFYKNGCGCRIKQEEIDIRNDYEIELLVKMEQARELFLLKFVKEFLIQAGIVEKIL